MISFGCFFGTCIEAPTESQKKVPRPPMWSCWRPNALQVVSRRSQQYAKIHNKSSRNRIQAAVATHRRVLRPKSDLLRGGTPQTTHRQYQKEQSTPQDAAPPQKKRKLIRQGNAAHRDRRSLRHGGGSGRRPYSIRYVGINTLIPKLRYLWMSSKPVLI